MVQTIKDRFTKTFARQPMTEEIRTTCGILLYDLNPLRIFLVRESGVHLKHFVGDPGNWGIPKGGLKKGKTPFETALCEFKEETGISLKSDSPFEDLGIHPYNKFKNIHAWALRWLPPAKTRFVCSTGRKRLNPKTQENIFIAEVIDWKIFTYEEALAVINYRQAFLLTKFMSVKEAH
jgi:8-oxo-dGTP pyrophosphatase MutT (NUDIX family)